MSTPKEQVSADVATAKGWFTSNKAWAIACAVIGFIVGQAAYFILRI